MATMIAKPAAAKAVPAARPSNSATMRADLIHAAYELCAAHVREVAVNGSSFELVCAAEDAARFVRSVETAMQRFERNQD